MSSETYAQAYALERFLQRQGPEYMQKAVAHQRRAAELSREGVLHVKTPAMRDRMEDLHADMTAYVMLLEDMQDNALEWMDVYENDFEPHMYALYEAMEAMSAAGENSGNLSSINGLWANTSQMGMQLGSLIPASSEQTLEQAVSPMRNCRQLLDALNVASFSDAQRAPHDKYVASLAAMENALENNKHRALKLAADLGKTYEYDERVLNASLDMASLVDERMAEEADVIAGSNAAGMRNSLIISGIGFVLAIILATVIIMSLMRVLQQSTAYASTISDGNFDYEPNIREKGEIGGLIGALSGIPQTLKRIRSEYSNLERNVEQGELLAHGQPEQFPGEFASLVRGTDNIINRFRIVLENIPSPVIMLNKDLKATYLNAVARELAGEEYRGKTCYELFRREDFDTDQDGLMRAVNTKRAATGETRAYPNGRAMDIRYTAIPMLDENNNIVSVLQLITDFTELKSQQEAMQRMTEKAMMISERVASASAQLAEKVEKVSTDADLQRERVESAASAMTQMNSAVLEVARGAGQASQQSDEARSNAENGAELVQELVFAINEVNNVAMRLQENMELLDSQVDNIGKVMDVITDIADQTNLLALNAAIEAAHAGEAGRGFAVVADEVRKLAEKTMQATEEVAANVEAIQQSSRANMAEVSATVEKVSAVTRLAEESGDALQGIVQLASETSGHVSSIAAAAEQQSASSEEIAHSLEELNMLVRTTSEEMMESSESVQELASTAQDLKNVLDGV